MIVILVLIVAIPMLIWLFINLIAKQCPNSSLGKRFNEWKADRALTEEQRQLRQFQRAKMTFVNGTNVSDENI